MNTSTHCPRKASPSKLHVTATADSKVYNGNATACRPPVRSTSSPTPIFTDLDATAVNVTWNSKRRERLEPSQSPLTRRTTTWLFSKHDCPRRNITKAPLTITAITSEKAADNNTNAQPGANTSEYGSTYDPRPTKFETYDTPAGGSGKTMTPSGKMERRQQRRLKQSNQRVAGRCPDLARRGRDADLHQPADDHRPIGIGRSTTCVSPSGPTPPKKKSMVASPSTTVKVQARDTFGNNAGP